MKRYEDIFLRLSRSEVDALVDEIGPEREGSLVLLRKRLLAARLRADRVPEIDWPTDLQELA